MTDLIRRDARKRSGFGRLVKASFYWFNVGMGVLAGLYILTIFATHALLPLAAFILLPIHIIGFIPIAALWLIGDGVLGILLLATRRSA